MVQFKYENDSEENYMISMQNMLGCFAIYKALRDENGNIIDFLIEYVNDAACKSNQLSREEQVGKCLLQILPSHRENTLFNEYCNVVETGKPFFKENFVYKDTVHNERLLIIIDIIAVKYKDGYAVTWRDKTKTQDLEEALQESEERFKAAFENAAIGMVLTGLDGKHLRVNHSFCEMTGYTERELLAMTFMDITYKDDLEIDLNQFKQAIEGKIKFYQLEKRYVHKNGNIIWANLSTSVVKDTKGKPLYFTTQFQDITKIKEANEALKYDKLKTDFFTNISHELRTPLNVILATNQFMELQMKKESEQNLEKMKRNISVIKQNCLRLLRLLNNIIDITKIDSGFYTLKLKRTDIVNLIKEIALSVSEYAKNKGILIKFNSAIKEKIIFIDPDKIERIMLNLLSNAVKYTNTNGNISVNVNETRDGISISVKDDGIGIPIDKQKIIFQRFRQVDNSLTRSNEGSGIGLSLVQSLIEMHGGKIQLISELGKGSEFNFELPVNNVSNDCNNEIFYNSVADRVERINIEFSDIYDNKR